MKKTNKGQVNIAVKMSADDMKWQAEDDARTLERAQEIRQDPERLKRATTLLQDKLDNIKSFVDSMKSKNMK